MKVKTMIMVAAICFAVIPMIVYAVLANFLVGQDADAQFRNELRSMAQNQTSSLQTLLGTAKSDIDTLAAFPEIKTSAEQAKAVDKAGDFITRFVGDSASVRDVSIVDESGSIIHGKNAGKAYDNFESYSEYKDDVLYFDDVNGTSGSGAAMFIKRKIGKSTLFVTYDISVIARFADRVSFYNQGRIIVVDSRLNWSSGTNINNNLDKQYTNTVVDRIATLTEGTPTEVIDYTNSSGRQLGTMVNVGGADGLTAIVSCPENKGGMFSTGSLSPIIAGAGLLAVISVVVVIFVAKAVTSPLKRIEETLEKIRRGDHEARIGTVSTNEYGQMSRAFNNLVDEIVVSEDRYRTISDMSDNIIFEWNFKTNEVMFSNNFNKKFSYRAPSDHFGDSFLLKAKVHPEDADRYRSDLDALEKGKNFERNEYRIKNIYGDFIWVLMRTATLKDKDGKPLKVVGVMVDIDRAKKSEQQLTERASYDALTELYNRETIESQIDNEISLSEMRKSEMAVLFIDVDDFKHYNDNYSHATGDQVLKFVAKTLRDATDGIGFAGRYGGDEFIVMLRDAQTNDPARIAQTIIAALDVGFDADIGERLTVSVSIGIAVIKDDYNTRVEYLIGKADDAMYSVKKSGKSNYAFI
ncbi:MAG: diguanylate cyclase [Ruminococcaceae bacterium]|nr:diguanylate cyclase [Oscillospiraceae bacterium]